MSYSPHTGSILLYLGYDFNCFDVSLTNGVFDITRWDCPGVMPTEAEVLANEKPWAGSVKTEEIYTEQELRSSNILMLSGNKLGTPMPRAIIDILEETYLHILVPAARSTIDEIDTPFWWGMQQLRNNRNTLLDGLQVWIGDPTKTADDILAFDVVNWAGWVIDRP